MTPRQRGLIEKITKSRNFELWDEGIEAVSALLAQHDRYEKVLREIASREKHLGHIPEHEQMLCDICGQFDPAHRDDCPFLIAQEALRCE